MDHRAGCRHTWPDRVAPGALIDLARSIEPSLECLETPAARGARMQALYEAHVEHVWIALQRLGVAWTDLEDLTHEVFLRVFREWERLDPGRPARPWLVGIAHHVAIDFLRRQRHLPIANDPPRDLRSGQPDPEQETAKAEERRLLEEVLQAMAPDRRTVLILHELLDQTAPEIAATLAIPLNTAYSRLRLARRDFEALTRQWRERP